MATYLRRWPVELFFKEWKGGQHQVTTDATRAERSVALTLMAYLVLLLVHASDIRQGQPWSAFALKHHFAWKASVRHVRRCA